MSTSKVSTSTEDLYTSGAYALENPDWHMGEAPWKARSILQMIHRHDLRPESIADLGCGTGDVLALLAESLPHPTRMVGFDIAPAAIEFARAKQSDNLSFQLGSPLENERFDLLLALDVFEHVDDPFSWVRNIKHLAEYTIFHIPLDLTVHRILRPRALAEIQRRYGHLHFYNRELALRFLNQTGYEVVDWTYTQEFREDAVQSPAAKLLKLSRSALFEFTPDLEVTLLGGCRLLVLAR